MIDGEGAGVAYAPGVLPTALSIAGLYWMHRRTGEPVRSRPAGLESRSGFALALLVFVAGLYYNTGTLTLEWTRTPGLGGNGRGTAVSEVWLMKVANGK